MAHQHLRHKLTFSLLPTTRHVATHHLRQLSTAATPSLSPDPPAKNRRQAIKEGSLFREITKAVATQGEGERVKEVLHRLVRQEGWDLPKHDVVQCVRDLRKYRRYHHCLEILEWMEESKFGFTEAEHALRLGIICKLKGVDEAEKYFDSLPPSAKNSNTYGALLNCYCKEKMTDKASSLFEKMDELKCASNVVAFNNMLSLYLTVGQLEKVLPLVLEMKWRNIPLNDQTYCVWIQSCASLGDLKGLERVEDEVQKQGNIKNIWNIYRNLATVYIKDGQSEKAKQALMKLEEALDNSNDFDYLAYHHMITVSASIGDLETVSRVWNKLKSKFRVCNNASYLTMLNALEKLDDIEGIRKCLNEWESSNQSYDIRIHTAVVGAYLKRNMLEEAKMLIEDARDIAGDKIHELQNLLK